MASIQEYLDLIKNAIYGKDVRQAIHDGIQQCYYDGKAGSTDLEARQRLDSAEGSISSLDSRMSTAETDIDVLDARVDQIVAPSGEAPSAAEVADGRIVDGVTYDLIGDAIRAVNTNLKSDIYGIASSVEAEKIKNLIDYDWLKQIKYVGYDVFTISGDSVTVNVFDGTAGADKPSFALKAGTYTLSVQNACRIQIFIDGTKVEDTWGASSVTFTINDTSSFALGLLSTTNSYPMTVGTVQLERGNRATAYVSNNNPLFYSDLQAKANNLLTVNRMTNLFMGRVSGKITNQGTVSEGVLRYTDNTVVAVGYHSTLSVNGGDELYFEGYCYNSAFPVVTFLYNGSILNTLYKKAGDYYGNIIVPPYVDTVVINGDTSSVCVAVVSNSGADNEGVSVKQYVDTTVRENAIASALKGKDIVWFGTSIPAGGFIGADVTRNYPTLIANKYGCTIHNEAIGSSPVHCKELNMVSPSNPYGFNPNFTLSSRCLSNTQEEMQWMIDHYNDSFWTNKPTLTDLYKTQMLSFSYEAKLDKYLTEETFPDLFVFDHGYNDYVSSADNYTGHEYEPYTLQGALNFLIRRIYSYNPEAKIIIIGNYKYQTRNGLVVQAQEAVAQRWDIPIFDNWHYTGLSEEQVYTDFTWVQSGGAWTKQSSASHLETLTNILLPDGVHPHSRPDDLIINRMANAIGEWLAVNATFDE